MLLYCKLITFVVSLTSTFLLVPFNKAFNLTMWPTLSQSFKQTAQLFESGHFHDGVEIKASVSSVRKFIYSDIVIAHKSIHYWRKYTLLKQQHSEPSRNNFSNFSSNVKGNLRKNRTVSIEQHRKLNMIKHKTFSSPEGLIRLFMWYAKMRKLMVCFGPVI